MLLKLSKNLLQQNIQQSIQFAPIYYYRKVQRNPKIRHRTVTPIYPPPGMNLEIPDWKPELYLQRIGGGCSEYADKFENIKEIFELSTYQMKEKGIPAKIRRYILNQKEQLRRGVLTFEYLSRRTQFDILKRKAVTYRYGNMGKIS